MFESHAARLILWKIKNDVSIDPIRIQNNPRIISLLIEILLHDEKSENRAAAAAALGKIGDPSAVEPLIAALGDPDINVRQCAAGALGMLKDPGAIPPLVAALSRYDPFLFDRAAADALSMLGEPQWAMVCDKKYVELMESDDERYTDALKQAFMRKYYAMTAMDALRRSKHPRAAEFLLHIFANGEHEVRAAVLDALAERRDTSTIEPLLEAMKEHRTYKVPVRHMNDYDEWETLEDRDEADLIREVLEKLKRGSD